MLSEKKFKSCQQAAKAGQVRPGQLRRLVEPRSKLVPTRGGPFKHHPAVEGVLHLNNPPRLPTPQPLRTNKEAHRLRPPASHAISQHVHLIGRVQHQLAYRGLEIELVPNQPFPHTHTLGTHLKIPVDISKYVHGRLNKQTAWLIFKYRSCSGAQP